MKLMQDIFDDTLRSSIDMWQIDFIIIIICLWSINYEIYQNPLKIEVFFGDVISGQDDVTALQFSMEVEILGWSFSKKIFGWIGATSCLLNLWLDTLLFKFQPLKKPTF